MEKFMLRFTRQIRNMEAVDDEAVEDSTEDDTTITTTSLSHLQFLLF